MVVCVDGGGAGPGRRRPAPAAAARLARFTAAVRAGNCRGWGATRPCLHIVGAVFAALADPVGVTAHRPGGSGTRRPSRARGLAAHPAAAGRGRDPHGGRARRLGLTDLVTSIDGLTAVGAATLLAETADLPGSAAPGRWSSTPGSVRGTTPAAPHEGKASSRRVGPQLRLAAWRAIWAALPNNPVLAARFHYLTTRDHNRLARQQARPPARPRCCAGCTSWSPAGSAGTPPSPPADKPPIRGCLTVHHPVRGTPTRAGRARTSLEEPTSRMSMSNPDRLLHELDSRSRDEPSCQLGRARGDRRSTPP